METIAIPLEAGRVECFFERDPRENLAIPTVCGCIAQHALDVCLLRPIVTATLADEGAADVAIEVYRFARTRVLGDMESQHGFTIVLLAMLGHFHVMVHLKVGVKYGKKVVLQFVRIVHATDFKILAALRNPQHQPASPCIGEGGNRLEHGFRQSATRCLELHVEPFAGTEKGIQRGK